jgi:dihydroneopterin aldolase
LDWSVAQHIVIDLNANVLFTSGNTDTEFTATVNYAF